MNAIALGLLTALLWGVTDFLVRMQGRSIGLGRSLLYTQSLGACVLTGWLVVDAEALGALRAASAATLAVAAGAAAFGAAAILALYRGLQIGRVAIVISTTCAYGAVTTLLELASGESLGTAQIGGIVAIGAGGAIVCAGEAGDAAGRPRRAGVLWGVASCFCFGVQFWLQGRFATPELGPVAPTWIYYLCSTATGVTVALGSGTPIGVTRREAVSLLASGTVGVGGYAAAALGFATGEVAVIGVLSSLSAAVTVGLAAVFLRERTTWPQWVGVAAIVAGLALVRS